MRNASIWKVIISAALALIGIIIVQGYWLKKSFDHTEKAFEEKVHICLRNVALQLSALGQVQLPSYNLVNQIAQDYYVVNIRDAIDANNLEFYLQKEFEAVSLNTDFEYGIYDCATDQMVYGNYININEDQPPKARSTSLPTYDEFVYYFGVRFPNRKGYILTNQWIPILFTGILVLAILFFLYATFEILRQKKLSDLQKDFINNMTHEFKTPLSSIKVSAEVFMQEPVIADQPRLQRYASIIHEQAARLNKQVERVLDTAGMQKKGIQLQKQALDLNELVHEVSDQLRSRIEKVDGHVTLDLTEASSEITADRLHLANILFNLVDNAIKYSESSPVIAIRTARDKHRLSLTVADQGVGINSKYLSRIGQKFFRVPTGDVHNAKGFGLGLHYVSRVAKAHGWKMDIDSEPGQGTAVTLTMRSNSTAA